MRTVFCSFLHDMLCRGSEEHLQNKHRTNLHPSKRAIRIVNKTAHREPTNQLSINLKAPQFKNLAAFKSIQIMYSVKKQQLPNNMQKLFQMREIKHNVRGTCVLNKHLVRTNARLHCTSVKEVNLWNNYNARMKMWTLSSFKWNILNRYRMHEQKGWNDVIWYETSSASFRIVLF